MRCAPCCTPHPLKRISALLANQSHKTGLFLKVGPGIRFKSAPPEFVHSFRLRLGVSVAPCELQAASEKKSGSYFANIANAAEPQTRNPNIEIRNKSEIRRKKITGGMSAPDLISTFEFRTCFGFRILSFEFFSVRCEDLHWVDSKSPRLQLKSGVSFARSERSGARPPRSRRASKAGSG